MINLKELKSQILRDATSLQDTHRLRDWRTFSKLGPKRIPERNSDPYFSIPFRRAKVSELRKKILRSTTLKRLNEQGKALADQPDRELLDFGIGEMIPWRNNRSAM